jgi:serine phosphatase RsbU (regulator of sigma subunit)
MNQGRLSAILYLENNLTAGAFTPQRLEILNLLSAQAAISIENARLYTNLEELVKERTARLQKVTDRLQGELRMAQKIQRSLLPASQPRWTELDLCCHTTPAREVGGDFYAYHTFGGRRFVIAVGDVSGKGMPAALLMGVSTASLQVFIDHDLEPAQLLAELDQALVPYTRSTNHNCALCYTELKGNWLRVVNAGCISPIVCRRDGLVEWVEAGGMPLGIGLGAEVGYQEAAIALERGDLVIMTSDGVVEATAVSGEWFGFERLEQTVARGPRTSAQAMLDHIRSEIATFVGRAEPHDDATIVVFML